MSRRPALFVGVAFCARTVDAACVGLTVIAGRHYLTPIQLDALVDARPAVIKVERWNGTALAADLHARGLPVVVSRAPRLSRDSVRGLGVADPSVDPRLAAAWLEVAQYVWGELQARHLSAQADAILLALSAHALHAPLACSFEHREPRQKPLSHNDRFIGLKVAVSRRFQILLGVADSGLNAIGRESVDGAGEVAEQRQGGDFLRGRGAGKEVSKHQNSSEAEEHQSATGARVAAPTDCDVSNQGRR